MSNHSERPSIIKIKARAWFKGKPHDFTVKGQEARALFVLVKTKKEGCTALEVSTWAFRLAAYVHELRESHSLDIQTIREEHDGGWHGRYVLLTPVEILEISKG